MAMSTIGEGAGGSGCPACMMILLGAAHAGHERRECEACACCEIAEKRNGCAEADRHSETNQITHSTSLFTVRSCALQLPVTQADGQPATDVERGTRIHGNK
jgi:hypothetical protein